LDLSKGVFQNLFIKLFKSLAPGRAAGGIFKLAASGSEVSHLESKMQWRLLRAMPVIGAGE